MKKTFLIFIVPILMIGLLGAFAQNERFYAVSQDDLADGPAFLNGFGDEPFAYDPDKPAPQQVMVEGPEDFGQSCFLAHVDSGDYASFRMSPKGIFESDRFITLGDLKTISYQTKQVYTTSTLSFQLKIYTISESDNWYGKRFNTIIPQYSNSSWNLNSTDSNLIFNSMYDKDAGTGWNTISKSLTQISNEYPDLMIEFIDIIASYQTTPPPVYSYLDAVVIELDNGAKATMDLVYEGTSSADTMAPGENTTVVVEDSGKEVQIVANSSASTGTLSVEEAAIDQGKSGFAGVGGGKAFDTKLVINSNMADGDFVATVKFVYTQAEVDALGIPEEWIVIMVWNEGTSQWVPAVDQNVGGTSQFMGDQAPDTVLGHYGTQAAANYCWANVDHFSEYAAGQSPTVPVELSTFSLE